MMKRIYTLLVIAALGFVGCQDVTVGYLRTTYAKYGIDSLHIGVDGVKVKMAEMEEQYWPLEGLGEVLAMAYKAKPIIQDLESEMDELYEEMDRLEGEEFPDEDRMDEISARLDEIESLVNAYYDEEYLIDDAKFYLGEGFQGDGMGYSVAEAERICNQYLSYSSTVEQGLPWTTATIEGVLGTEPVQYSIADVTSEDGNAEIFRRELVIYGGGRMQLPFDCKAPKGKYRVSILIKNEGYSNVLENVFTFVVD